MFVIIIFIYFFFEQQTTLLQIMVRTKQITTRKSHKKFRSFSRKKIRPTVIYRMQQTVLFQRTLKHHENCLKEMFIQHYKPTSSVNVNREWTLNLSDSIMEKLRVHLSWSMGLNVLEWDHQNIGNQIIETLTSQNILKILLRMNKNKCS